jgi:DNA-binding SARP family transcriptional activator
MPPLDEIRIRLLGIFEARRPDGSVVGVDEWRTGKNVDLLRILALSNGRPVHISSVVDKLWPGVSMDRARASVRTAASQVRRALGVNCVERQNGSLVLNGAVVDVVEFRDTAHRAQQAAREGDHRRTLDLTDRAERIYAGDFHAHNDDSEWAVAERTQLRRARQATLCSAADAAIALGSFPLARDLAEQAVGLERTSEAAHRALMVAYAGLGETASALRAFEACRAHLAEELGVDPSAQTKALHLRVLRGDFTVP